MQTLLIVVGVVALILFVGGIGLLIPVLYRIVVPTNSVHIIQRRKKTVPYGRGLEAGNVYYRWPPWVPKFGITRIVLPTSIFDIDLKSYDAYDIGKVPFQVDIKAFFKVDKAETAAQRVESFDEMNAQLADILRGAIRSILASAEIESIMEGRREFGEMFTSEVAEQLIAWGVSTVKNIEFMDIRDTQGSEVVSNIMAKKQSAIEKDSRTVVAGNIKNAQMAEIDAVKETEVRQQEADLLVGQKTADKDKQVGIANELAQQEIKAQAKITAEKEMEVKRVNEEVQAGIDKNVAETIASKDKEVKRLAAEATLIAQEREADGVEVTAKAELTKQQRNAEGIEAVGAATASAEKLLQMASVDPQIALAKEIGENEGYQHYLLGTKGLEVGEVVGVAKADALVSSDLKIIANAGSAEGGMTKLMDIFSTEGGTNIGGMLEALSQTEVGKGILDKLTATSEEKV